MGWRHPPTAHTHRTGHPRQLQRVQDRQRQRRRPRRQQQHLSGWRHVRGGGLTSVWGGWGPLTPHSPRPASPPPPPPAQRRRGHERLVERVPDGRVRPAVAGRGGAGRASLTARPPPISPLAPLRPYPPLSRPQQRPCRRRLVQHLPALRGVRRRRPAAAAAAGPAGVGAEGRSARSRASRRAPPPPPRSTDMVTRGSHNMFGKYAFKNNVTDGSSDVFDETARAAAGGGGGATDGGLLLRGSAGGPRHPCLSPSLAPPRAAATFFLTLPA